MDVPWPEMEEQHDQADCRPVDGLASTGRRCSELGKRGENKGEGGEMEGEGYCESGGIWMEWIVILKRQELNYL